MEALHIGGCILNRSPNDMHGHDCDCFKIEFVACSFGKVYCVKMCREWVRYMAQHEKWYKTHGAERTSMVVKKYVRDALGAGDDWFRWHSVKYPRSKAGIEVAGSYKKLPTHFIEVVMDNRYGRLEQMIPCHTAVDPETTWWRYPMDWRDKWTGWTKGYRDVVCVNLDRHKMFIQSLERACCRKEACKLTGLNNRKMLVAMTELLTIKTKEHATDKQQISAALPI